MEIRKAVVMDIPALVPLWIDFMDYHAELDPAFTRDPAGADNWARYIEEKMKDEVFAVFVAAAEGRLVGYAVAFVQTYPPIWTVKARGFIDELYVDPASRRGGVGRRLLAAAEAWLTERGMAHVELKVDVANVPTRRFWKDMGFAPRVEIMSRELQERTE